MQPITITAQDGEFVVIYKLDETLEFNSKAEWNEGVCEGMIGGLEYPASASAHKTVREIVRSKMGDGQFRTVQEVRLGKLEYADGYYSASFSAEYEFNTDARNEADWSEYMTDIQVRY